MGRETKEQYRAHYESYQSRPEQIAKRSQRNKARRLMEAKHGKAALAGKDVDHKVRIKHGGGNGEKNLRIQSPSKNRAWKSSS